MWKRKTFPSRYVLAGWYVGIKEKEEVTNGSGLKLEPENILHTPSSSVQDIESSKRGEELASCTHVHRQEIVEEEEM